MGVTALGGRILYLSADPARIEAQLAGARLTRAGAGTLRDDISTDEITPVPVLVHFDERLGRYPYTGLKVGDRCPVGVDTVRDGGFSVVVAGRRYGKGSSREHSPVAERAAGIHLVVAESFERIYRQNADNVGLFTCTDFGVLDRIERGEAIGLEELVASRDRLAGAILRCGGLLRFGRERMGAARPGSTVVASDAPMTMFEKILARHALEVDGVATPLEPGAGGFVRADWRFIHEYYSGMCAHLLDCEFGAALALHDSGGIVTFEDHTSYAQRSHAHRVGGFMPGMRAMIDAHRAFVARHGLRDHGLLPRTEGSGRISHVEDSEGISHPGGSEGISHALMAERYALPGQLVAGTDSHTPHSGALGCVAFGVGTTDMANAFVTGAVRITVPESLRVQLDGLVPAGVTAKDIALHLLADPAIRAGAGVGRMFEFTGSAVVSLSTDERATLTNMCAELGGFGGLVAPDAETVRFIQERRGVRIALEPWMASDPGARYAHEIRLDCSRIGPMVARPGDPGNGVALAALAQRPRLDIAYGGSCTAGKREDFEHYHQVLSWAASRGLRVASGVQLFLQFGTQDVRNECARRGYLTAFEAVGALMLEPSCGACANCGPGASERAEQVTVSAIHRNFPGRSGPGQVWLASPPTVAASAIAGELVSFDELKSRYGG